MLRRTGDTQWALAGNVRPDMAETINALVGQQGGIHAGDVSPTNGTTIRITSIKEVIPLRAGVKPLIAGAPIRKRRSSPFTVTEAGYHLDPKNVLDTSAADIANDLAAVRLNNAGTTIYGRARRDAETRMEQNGGPVTLLCCDNLRHNGDRSRSGLMQFIQGARRR